jgi:hypothetical protein
MALAIRRPVIYQAGLAGNNRSGLPRYWTFATFAAKSGIEVPSIYKKSEEGRHFVIGKTDGEGKNESAVGQHRNEGCFVQNTMVRGSIWKKITAGTMAGMLAMTAWAPGIAMADDGQHDCTNQNEPCAHGRTFTQGHDSSDSSDATESTAETKYYIKADDSKICASVPTEVHVRVNADGTLITPTNATIKNGSIFEVRVSDIEANATGSDTTRDSNGSDGFYLVKQSDLKNSGSSRHGGSDVALQDSVTNNNAVYLKISPGGSSEGAILGDCVPNDGVTLYDPENNWGMGKNCGDSTGDDGICDNEDCVDGENDNDYTTDTILLKQEGKIFNVTKDLGSDQQFCTVTWTFKAGQYTDSQSF